MRVLDGFPCLCCRAAKRAQSDKPLTLSIQYGMLRDRVYFSLDLSGITAEIRAGVGFYTPTLKNEVLLRNKAKIEKQRAYHY